MRSKVTVVLLFLNVVLFYYIFQYENRVQIHESTKRVLGAETANIEKFTRTSRNAPTITAEKRGDNWWLTQPFEWPANRNAVDHVLHELQFLEHETSFAVADLAKSDQSLADFGLADPAMTFTFTTGGKDYALKLGNGTETSNRLYVLSPDGARIHVVSRALVDSLALGAEQLRAEAVFTIPVFEVRSLALQTANATKIRLRREGQRWTLEAPILARAAKAETETTLTELTGLQVRRFLEPRDADPTRTGLTSPQLRVTLEGNARRETLLLGNLAGPATTFNGIVPVEVYAKLEDKPAVFITRLSHGQITDDQVGLLDRLRLAQDKLRDKHVLDFDFANVTALSVAAPDRPELSLQRLDAPQNAEAWQVVVRGAAGQIPGTIPADPAIVQDFLQRLKLLAATKFLSDAPSAADLESYGFNRPEREITLNLRTGGGPKGDEPSTTTLQIGTKPATPGVAFARVANAPFVYEIPADLLEDVPVTALHFRQRILRELPEGTHVTALTLTDLSNNSVVVTLNATAGGELTAQSIAASDAPEAKRAAFNTLLAEARKLRAKRFVADSFDPARATLNGSNPPWRYRLDVALTLTGGNAQNVTSSLFLTERLGGTTQLGGTPEFGGITYELPQELVDALFALTYAAQHDPGPPPATPTPEPAEKPKS